MINNIKVFDCTCREIGYQTGWNFSKQTIQDIYRFADNKGIDYMELGFFHQPEADPNRGIFRYCSYKNDEIMEIFTNVKNITKLSAMRDIQRPIARLLPKKNSVIDTIRILTRSNETDFGMLDQYVTEVMELGYEVFINFTSSGYNSIEQNIKFAECVKQKGVQAIAFADTESVMTEEYVSQTIRECHQLGIKVGIHFHDKKGMADQLANVAIKEGVDYIDVTHLGLGGKSRDGNLTMEYLLRKLNVAAGYEATIVKNEIIEDLIKFHSYSAAE